MPGEDAVKASDFEVPTPVGRVHVRGHALE
jgi:hypothetical protein